MRNFIISFALLFSAISFGQMSFGISDLDLRNPLNSEANIGWFMTDDIMLTVAMASTDAFEVGARYYTGFCDNMFIEASTNAMDTGDGTEYQVGVAAGWTKSLGIWKLQFEPMIAVDNIDELEPYIGWALRFNL